jgi:hypothetical protein
MIGAVDPAAVSGRGATIDWQPQRQRLVLLRRWGIPITFPFLILLTGTGRSTLWKR